ncbi:CatB-related O-acetyltransferase [Vibrio parahaemolyticus]|uniref:CatB-related O-acetyltransferase n=1 Tax=Vibrio mediterranei TaxID=689 RepID=UPI004069840F
MSDKHWTQFELLHQTVSNKNIHIRGTHSYYSHAYDEGFEASVVRYLHGDKQTRDRLPPWHIDQLFIGDYVCIGAEAVILMGGNHTHRLDWFSLYPFRENIEESYQSKGDTHINDGVWIGMRAMIMPGVSIGEGAVVAANSVVTKDIPPYTIVGGSPAKVLKLRFDSETIQRLLDLNIYQWDTEKFDALKPFICAGNIDALEKAHLCYGA